MVNEKPELKKLIKKIANHAINIGGSISIFDEPDVKFDIEFKEDFGDDIISYFEPSTYEKDDEEATGWLDNSMHEDFTKLMAGWNWDAITLINDRILVIKSDLKDNSDITFTMYNKDNLVDDSIESRNLFNENIIPEGVMEKYNRNMRNVKINRILKKIK